MPATTLQGHVTSLLHQLSIPFELHEGMPFFVLATNQDENYFHIRVKNNWITVTIWNLMPPLDINDPKLSAFYLSLLIEQDTSQNVKYSINVENELEMSVEISTRNLTITSLQEAIQNLVSASENNLPLILEPFIDIIFNKHIQNEELNQIEELIN